MIVCRSVSTGGIFLITSGYMRISIRVKANSKKEFIKKEIDEYVVAVREPAREGKANEAVQSAVAEYFGVPRSRVQIVSGHTASRKIIEVNN